MSGATIVPTIEWTLSRMSYDGDGRPKERRRRYWTRDEKRRIVVESLEDGASAADVARRHDLNANLLFTWRRQLGMESDEPRVITPILPVTIESEAMAPDVSLPGRGRPDGNRSCGRRPDPCLG